MTSNPLASNSRVSTSRTSPSSWMTSTVGRANDKVALIIAVLVFRHMRWMLPLGVAAGLAACSGGGTHASGPQAPLPGPVLAPEVSDIKLELPSVPAKIEV